MLLLEFAIKLNYKHFVLYLTSIVNTNLIQNTVGEKVTLDHIDPMIHFLRMSTGDCTGQNKDKSIQSVHINI